MRFMELSFGERVTQTFLPTPTHTPYRRGRRNPSRGPGTRGNDRAIRSEAAVYAAGASTPSPHPIHR